MSRDDERHVKDVKAFSNLTRTTTPPIPPPPPPKLDSEIAKSLRTLEDDAESGMFERTVVITTSDSELRRREAWRKKKEDRGDPRHEDLERRQRPAARRRRKLDHIQGEPGGGDPSRPSKTEELEQTADAVIAAVKAGNRDALHFLLSSHKGTADILANAKNVSEHGESALMMASEAGDLSVVQVLLNFGAQPSMRDHEGRSALHFAIANHHQEIAEALLLAQAARSD